MIGRLVKPWPGKHGGKVDAPASSHAIANAIVPGSLIEVSGPYPPNPDRWNCGTPVVWHVDDGRIPFDSVYCCVHQITFDLEAEHVEAVEMSEVMA